MLSCSRYLLQGCMYSSVLETFFLVDPFWLRKITTDPHIFAHVNGPCPHDRYLKLKINVWELILDGYGYITGTVSNNALYDLTLMKLTVVRFVGTGSSLTRYMI
jgi:hypothetical protein